MTTATLKHHPDCDGWRTAHKVTFHTDRGMMEAHCEECGKLHVGSFGPAAHAACKAFQSHSAEVECDGRCMEWS